MSSTLANLRRAVSDGSPGTGFEFGNVCRRYFDRRGELRGSQATVFAPSIGWLYVIRLAI